MWSTVKWCPVGVRQWCTPGLGLSVSPAHGVGLDAVFEPGEPAEVPDPGLSGLARRRSGPRGWCGRGPSGGRWPTTRGTHWRVQRRCISSRSRSGVSYASTGWSLSRSMTGVRVTWECWRNWLAWPIVIGPTPSIRATPCPVRPGRLGRRGRRAWPAAGDWVVERSGGRACRDHVSGGRACRDHRRLCLLEEGEGAGGVGQDAEGLGAAGSDRVGVAVLVEDLGDPVDHRDQVDDLPGGGLRDQGLQAVLVGLAGDHEPVQLGGLPAGLGGVRVGGDDPGLEQVGEAAPRQRGQVGRRRRVDLAGLGEGEPGGPGAGRDVRACQTRTCPASSAAHNRGSRCRTSSASAIRVAAASMTAAQQHPELGGRELPRARVPSRRTASRVRCPGARTPEPCPRDMASAGCRSADCAASTGSPHSACTRAVWLAISASATVRRSEVVHHRFDTPRTYRSSSTVLAPFSLRAGYRGSSRLAGHRAVEDYSPRPTVSTTLDHL